MLVKLKLGRPPGRKPLAKLWLRDLLAPGGACGGECAARCCCWGGGWLLSADPPSGRCEGEPIGSGRLREEDGERWTGGRADGEWGVPPAGSPPLVGAVPAAWREGDEELMRAVEADEDGCCCWPERKKPLYDRLGSSWARAADGGYAREDAMLAADRDAGEADEGDEPDDGVSDGGRCWRCWWEGSGSVADGDVGRVGAC